MSIHKHFDDQFNDSTENTFYRVTITSENGQRKTFHEVGDLLVRDIYDDLLDYRADLDGFEEGL